ncbi:phosphodiester glycosidase family protein [Acidisphaera sp. S103]|uniref:phosphodiester glycosidase family protein n=1 Tax=Acidisphaera sp. S103 TaxID=1747223 RepID=UPI00131AB89C|nr:phosphodiester glycosidase family protein [Acidisphaera sp. S103]
MAVIRFLLCLAVFGLLAEAPARAADCAFSPRASQPVFKGVQLQTVTVTCPWNGSVLISTAHVARVDLTIKGLSLVTLSAGSAQAPRTFLVSGALQSARDEIAVNANLFTGCCDYAGGGASTSLLGLAYGNGALWSPIGNNPQQPAPPGDFLSSLIVANGQPRIVTLTKGQALPPGLTLAVTGTHRILTEGRNTAPADTTPSDWFGPNARTVVGYNAGLNGGSQVVFPRLWLVAVDSVQGVSSGVTLPQAAGLLLFLGASDGINLDGGGSTTMVRQAANGAATFVNVPKDWPPLGSCQVPVVADSSCERYVGFGLGVVAPPLP